MEDNIIFTKDWPGIGCNYNKFAGNFDGAEHKISNLKLLTANRECGLFGSTAATARVINLRVEGEIAVVPNDNWWGMIVGANRGYIGNCNCEAKIKILLPNPISDCYIGLIAGGNQQDGTIEKCVGTADFVIEKVIEGSEESESNKRIYIGGVTGLNQKNAEIFNCETVLNGDFLAIERSMVCIGGITGKNYKNGKIHDNRVSGKWKLRDCIYGLTEENGGEISGCTSNGTLEIEIEGKEGRIYGDCAENNGKEIRIIIKHPGRQCLG